MKLCFRLAVVALSILCIASVALGEAKIKQTDLFVSGEGGYHTYRIPAIVAAGSNVLLAFCEGRKNSAADSGDIDILLKRSMDGGNTWGKTQLIASDGTDTCGNPCPIVDSSDGTIWLPFCKNLAEGDEWKINAGSAPRTVWITKSTDLGATWSEPVEITRNVKLPSWTWYATGPGHGIQLKSGRLLAACDHVDKSGQHSSGFSHTIYSDDHGKNWKIGGLVPGGNESTAVELSDGRVYINCRNAEHHKEKVAVGRIVAYSTDGGLCFSKPVRDSALIEPVCAGSAIRVGDAVVFCNPAGAKREKLTIKLSHDGCATWPVSRVLNEGHSAYSDLAVAKDGDICCLYERGDKNPYEKITFSKFNLDWLAGGSAR